MKTYKNATIPQTELLDMRIYQAGAEECQPSKQNGPVARSHFLFHYVLTGKGSVLSTNSAGIIKEYQITAGQGFLFSPTQVNTYISDSEEPWHYLWFEIDGLLAKRMFSLAGLTIDHPIYKAINHESKKTLEYELNYLIGHLERSPFHLIAHLYLALDEIIESSSNKKIHMSNKRSDYYVYEALNFIEMNYHLNITVEDVANYCGLNRSYLGRLFRSVTAKGVQEVLIDYRMTKACDLLKITDYSIKTISESVGYTNQLYFSKVFKERFGNSPLSWRQNHQVY